MRIISEKIKLKQQFQEQRKLNKIANNNMNRFVKSTPYLSPAMKIQGMETIPQPMPSYSYVKKQNDEYTLLDIINDILLIIGWSACIFMLFALPIIGLVNYLK